ncbi:hypothetical protein GIX82_06680 [Lactobacillus reuteri]|nr:hypothetical protein [Limosilactobacillus reuteri]
MEGTLTPSLRFKLAQRNHMDYLYRAVKNNVIKKLTNKKLLTTF